MTTASKQAQALALDAKDQLIQQKNDFFRIYRMSYALLLMVFMVYYSWLKEKMNKKEC